MSYHIGDCVRVKSLEALTAISKDAKDLTPVINGFHIDHLFFNPKMIPYCGRVYTVCGSRGSYFNLADGAGNVLRSCDSSTKWAFSEEMLEPVEDDPAVTVEPALSFEELFAKETLQ